MTRLLLAAALAALPFATAAHVPPLPPVVPQAPTLRASVDQVVVDVVVTDANGRAATGLTAADFDLADRGKPQTISASTEVVLPLPDARRDGRYRSIEVRMKRPGLRVSVRRGYREPDDESERKAAAKVERRTVGDTGAAVTGPLAPLVSRAIGSRGLPMTVQALAFPGTVGNVSLVLEFRPGAVPAAPRAGVDPPRLDFVVVPVAAGGRVLPSIEGHVPLAADGADAERIEARGVRVIQAATLPPGDYQLRIAARETMPETSGAVFCDLTVPQPTRRLQMSGLVLNSSTAGATPSASRDGRLERGLGGRPPTTARTFTTAEKVSLYAELVDPAQDAVRDVTLVTVVRDAQGREVVRRSQGRANAGVAAGQTFAYASDLTLAALPPGRYVLRVEAQAAGSTETVREVPFDVRSAAS